MRARKPSLINRMSPVRSQAQLGRAIAATLRLGSVGYENATNANGERLIWLADAMADRLGAMRRPGDGYSDAILRLVAMEGACAP